MSLDLHREAEALMGHADQAKAQRRLADAARLNREAAEVEARVFDLLPLDRPKTRGITAISSVALYREAGELKQAIRQAEIFLTQEAIVEPARVDLREMIEEMRAEIEASAAIERAAP